jgi:transcription elongation factor Elf1
MKTTHNCPVCGFDHLKEAPHSKSGGGSFEICPACGFQFGVSDDDDGLSYEEWREDWVERGMEWTSKGITQPQGWKPATLLKAVVKKKPEK